MLLFPFTIFVPSMLLHRGEYPRVVVAVRTSQDRLSSIEALIKNLVKENVTMIYLVLGGEESNIGDAAELPLFIRDILTEEVSTRDVPQLQMLYTNTIQGPTLSFVVMLVMQSEHRMVTRTTGGERLVESYPDGKTSSMIIAAQDTRILIINDESPWPSISSLVQGSLQEPDAVLSETGAMWRSYFRQVKNAPEFPSYLDKFPNIVLHSTDVIAESADVLVSSTGIIFREGVLAPTLPSWSQMLNDLLADESTQNLDAKLIEHEAEDVVWSAVLEKFNVSRKLTAFGDNTLNIINNTTRPTYSSGHWMAAAFQLQQRWKVWQRYTFLDWSSLTSDQKNGIECEGRYDQECDMDICQPNSEQCGNVTALWPSTKEFTGKSGRIRLGLSR
jgi:hypothetical protein